METTTTSARALHSQRGGEVSLKIRKAAAQHSATHKLVPGGIDEAQVTLMQ